MKSIGTDRIKNSSRGTPVLREEKNAWLKLVMGIALIIFFIFGFGRISSYIPGAARMARVIDDWDLRTAAIFYTDLDTSSQSAEYIRCSLEYTPRQRQ
jgi:hypothetical protein